VAIYQEHNPEKIKDVILLLEKYDGKEDASLLQAVKKSIAYPPVERGEATAEAPGKKWS
jgi:hypothetical protein